MKRTCEELAWGLHDGGWKELREEEKKNGGRKKVEGKTWEEPCRFPVLGGRVLGRDWVVKKKAVVSETY